MNKAYSNKALPAGTVLREWRIEEVLGVGGFGIVYKAKGIYFNELVAIKEYFPSSISERDSDATVVPIDSDVEEVHALGLKKFVEEAKLLWNLSTPSRHPNIVSVRSLFEIHGTAYMVMDFEDGSSLSKMIKQGRRFNERSLWGILRPIAEGLDRAHRVGVLHRDIKPPNILINEDSRPVLIDFGSARFEAAEATSTKVTFHTPPYAAIEQYVKTYPQGPWTDVYALGVVLHECVTGEKPPEVLERLHAGLGKPLADGKWPGYSKRFLAAVDSAMIVKPEDRPQSIGEWLALFGRDTAAGGDGADVGDEATRFYAQQVQAEEIQPLMAAAGTAPRAPLETGVPADPKQVQFKRAGEETEASKKAASEAAALASLRRDGPTSEPQAAAAAAAPGPAGRKPAEAAEAKKRGRTMSPAVIAGAAIAMLVLGGGGVLMLGRGDPSQEVAAQSSEQPAAATAERGAANGAGLPPGEIALANELQPAADSAAQQEARNEAAQEVLRAEQSRAAAAEAELAAIKKAAARSAAAKASKVASAASGKTDQKAAAAEADAAVADSGGVSPAKLSQFYALVDEGRSKAKQAMRSRNGETRKLAKGYDKYLKTLKASMAGINSNSEADRMITQARQTNAYIDFLLRQP
jgi:hypothetical protein